MNLYVSYAYYVSTYKGNITEEEFEKAIIPATAYVRRITFGRADQNKELNEVKLATCAVCEILANDEKVRAQHSGRIVASESTDGYSVSYENGKGEDSADNLLLKKIYKSAELYLEPTGFLYVGVE